MPSRSPSRERPYRDSSPTSPLTPLSPSVLPQCIRRSRPRSALLSNGRVKIMLIGVGCILMGWMLTSALGPPEPVLAEYDPTYDLASGGVLEDPTGFGTHSAAANKRPGIIGETDPEDDFSLDHDLDHDRKPSVTGALAELHDAVKYKLQSWNPYFVKGAHSGDGANGTARTKHKGHNNTSALLAGESVTDGVSEEDRLGARIRIGKCTILFDGNSYWERAIRTHERHDKEHGYRLHVLRQHLMDDVWSKPAYILSLLLRELAKPDSERLDWLFWVDADTVLLNPHIPIDVFLPPPGSEFDDIHLVYSNDWNGLNNGVFPIRVNKWAANLFAGVVSYRHFRPNDPLVFRDQSAMDSLMHEPEFAPHVVQAPQRWFNAYQGEHNETLAPYQIRRGDFLVHFAGVPARDERMGYWLDRAEQHLDDWEIPLKSTSYPQEARDFWAEQRQKRQHRKEELADQRLKAKELLAKVETQLTDYSDRLEAGKKEVIEKRKEELRGLLEDEARNSDLDLIKDECKKLEKAADPLNVVLTDANKLLLKSAHEAIFAGEKDLLEGDSASDPELQRVSETVTILKNLVMMPQDKWNRHDISSATNAVTEARAQVQDKAAALQKVEEQSKKAAQELEAVQKQVQAEAGVEVPDVQPALVIATAAPITITTAEATSTAEAVVTPAAEQTFPFASDAPADWN